MVAIALYRGNLHRVPDLPRRWLMPNDRISVKDFKSLVSRRSKALSRLPATTPNPNPNSTQQEQLPNQNECKETDVSVQPKLESNPEEGTSKDREFKEVKEIKVEGLDGDDRSDKPVDGSDSGAAVENDKSAPVGGDGNSEALKEEKAAETVNTQAETSDKVDVLNEKETRKKEVEEKLQVLNVKKHNLVQVLKQILNAEEELKRRNSMQGLATRPSVPLQVDVINDSALMTRHTSRIGEANPTGDVEGGEADDVSNHNMHSRHILRMSSMSPSSESPLRRPAFLQHNAVPHPSRATLGASASPSRFAPMGNQGHPANLPTVSVSGTSYIASSPSPAASGGTSALRDTRHPSPWN